MEGGSSAQFHISSAPRALAPCLPLKRYAPRMHAQLGGGLECMELLSSPMLPPSCWWFPCNISGDCLAFLDEQAPMVFAVSFHCKGCVGR